MWYDICVRIGRARGGSAMLRRVKRYILLTGLSALLAAL